MFEISKQEYKNLHEWLEKHNKTCLYADPMSQGAIGGRLSYIFTPTGLGTCISVKCACDKEINITDTSDW